MVSTTEDSVGLGWEVWFLFAVLAAAGIGGVLVASVVGGGVVPAIDASAATVTPPVPVDPTRAALGAVIAGAALTAAARIVRTTNWRAADEVLTDP